MPLPGGAPPLPTLGGTFISLFCYMGNGCTESLPVVACCAGQFTFLSVIEKIRKILKANAAFHARDVDCAMKLPTPSSYRVHTRELSTR